MVSGHTNMNTNRWIWTCLCVLLSFTSLYGQQTTASGYVMDAKSGESLIGVSVYTQVRKAGTITNAYGYFSMQADAADSILISYLGYQTVKMRASDMKDMRVKLQEATGELKEVEVKVAPVQKMQHGNMMIDMKQLNQLPALGGERDLLKAVQLMPGVKKGADGTVGLLVRGGATDQNLVLLDDAPVYNPAHLLGFFSLFNTDAVKEAGIQTGGFTANYGGRLSSVLDIRMNDGNTSQHRYSGSVGLLASRFSAQGPLARGKGSYLAAGRISYINKLYEAAGKQLPFYFYDVNLKLNYKLSKRDQLFLSMYGGDDVLNTTTTDSSGDIRIGSKLGNQIAALRWNHAFANQHMFGNLTLFTSRYRYQIEGILGENSLRINANILDLGMRYSLDHYVNNAWSLKYGGEWINHAFSPNSTELKGNFNDNLKAKHPGMSYLNEVAVYGMATWRMAEKWQLQTGLRMSGALVNQKQYINPEPRMQLSYQVNKEQAFTVSYARMAQYMFLLSSSSAMLPTDLWYGVSKKVKPQLAHIIALGYQISRNVHTIKAEVYYKPMQQLVEYKEGTTEIANSNADDIAVQGKGLAYGFELMHRFQSGKWNITTGYTLSWSYRKFDELNNGRIYLARYDRRHDFSLVVNYDFNARMSLSAVWTYATGSRFTPVIGRFMMPNGNFSSVDLLPIYTGRNAVKLADAHKLDVNLVIKNKPGKRYLSEWHIGAYNVYNQTQPFRVRLQKNSDGNYSYKQVGLFGFVPSIGYQFKF